MILRDADDSAKDQQMHEITLGEGWQFKQRQTDVDLAADFQADEGWLAATVPGTVHQDLAAQGRIPDPFVGLHERDVQWVGEADWLYRCAFDAPEELAAAPAVALCCDGLDTFATVWLNGEEVLQSDNMFVPGRASVTGIIRPGRNTLWLRFESAWRCGKEREAAHGQAAVWNGDPSRVYVRKAQYHWGWDWGPCLLTAGPWLPIRVEAYEARIAELHTPVRLSEDFAQAARIAELHTPVRLSEDFAQATLDVAVAVEAASADEASNLRLHLEIFDPAGERSAEARLPVAGSSVEHPFTVEAPRLWQPNGYGEQPLYRLAATVERDGTALDRREQRLGLRSLELRQEPLEGEEGTSFVFVCNGAPLFCGGANWIPADSFLPRVTPERYRTLLQQAADANMTMLRVWGGGVYEPDVFYDLCDELGLLVWQDFMFGCGMYPALPWFQESVRAEAEAAVRRLRHHPCLALWCGNNEDYQVAAAHRAYTPAFSGDFAASPFPGRELYERLLPEVCAALDPDRPYWPGSAYGGGENENGPSVGDRHVWDIWHGAMAEIRDYPRYAGRFVSEFGMQALPDLPTVAAFAPEGERFGQSRTVEFHNKAAGGSRRLAVYLNDTVRDAGEFADYVYATQLMQAEALATAIRGWRRRFGGPGQQRTAGALVWQLDDCWPGVSWSIIDYFGRPKPAYYTVRRALAPLAIELHQADGAVEVWAVNGTLEPIEAVWEARAWTLAGDLVAEKRRSVALAANQATACGEVAAASGQPAVVGVCLLVADEVVARASLWPEPYKYLALPDPGIDLTRLDGERVRLSAQRPAKGVLLAAGDGVRWSDNMLDLQPGDPQTIHAPGLGHRPIELRWLAWPPGRLVVDG